MPLYAFHCDTCAQEFEHELPRGSAERPPCPTCGGVTRKIIKPPVIAFKGSGFYKTDSKTVSTAPKKEPKKDETVKPATPAPAPEAPKPKTSDKR